MLNQAQLWIKDRIAPHVWQIDEAVTDSSKKKYYAVDIELDASIDNNLSIPSIGLLVKHIRLISGTPGFDGTAGLAFYEDGSANDWKWFEGIFVDDRIGNSSQRIDVLTMGNVCSLAGFRFSINDCEKQWQYINNSTSGIHFINRKVTHYVVLDNIFYPIWTGVIEDTAFNDEQIEFNCTSAFESVHKPLPPRSAISPEFPNTSEGDSGKTIPIVIGSVPDAKLVLVNKSFAYMNITDISSNLYIAGLHAYDLVLSRPIFIITWDKQFLLNELQDKYLLIMNGGGNIEKGKLYRITTNSGSYVTTLSVSPLVQKYITQIQLVEPLSDYTDITTNFATKYKTIFEYTTLPLTWQKLTDYWNVKILDFSAQYAISNKAITAIIGDTTGIPFIKIWNEQSKKFDDISKLFTDADLTNSTINLKPKVLLGEDSAKYTAYLKPNVTEIFVGRINPDSLILEYDTSPLPVLDGTPADIVDRDRATFAAVTYPASYNALAGMLIKIEITDEIIKAAQNGSLGISVDVTHDCETGYNYDFSLLVAGADVYDNEIAMTRSVINANRGRRLQLGNTVINMLEDEYFSFGGNANGEICHLAVYYNTQDGIKFLRDIKFFDSEMIQLIAKGIIKNIYVSPIISDRIGGYSPSKKIIVKEISFVQTASASIENDAAVVSVRGEKYFTNETNNVYRAIQHILHDYDLIPTGNVDIGNLNTKRNTWHVGRQLHERKSSLDYIQELCQQSFIAYWQSRSGKLSFNAWLDNTSVQAFHDDNNILRASIRGVERASMSALYNEFSVKYGFDNVTNSYKKEFFITKVDESAFPLISDETWKTFVGGLSDYASAKALWDLCHTSYLKNKTTRKFTIECPWFVDCSLLTGADAAYVGTASSAYKFLILLVEWATQQKDLITYELDLNEITLQLEMLHYISFKDLHITDDTTRGGWVVGLSNNPNSNTRSVTIICEAL
jgi:hypothetical protein